MRRDVVSQAFVLVLLSLLPSHAMAQETVRSDAMAVRHAPQDGTLRGLFGVRGGVFVEEGAHSGPLVGIDGWFPIGSDWFAFNPSLDFAFDDNFVLIIGGDLCFVVAPRSRVRLWVGGGGSLIDRTGWLFGEQDQTDLAGNLLLGVDVGDDDLRFFVQVKSMFSKETHMSFVSGLRF